MAVLHKKFQAVMWTVDFSETPYVTNIFQQFVTQGYKSGKGAGHVIEFVYRFTSGRHRAAPCTFANISLPQVCLRTGSAHIRVERFTSKRRFRAQVSMFKFCSLSIGPRNLSHKQLSISYQPKGLSAQVGTGCVLAATTLRTTGLTINPIWLDIC